ncbi:MAG: hypothetical protein M3R69_03055 [Acidobacteriota bacterium]|nr:hypothetical protein [Acidobacteriota bacterium]
MIATKAITMLFVALMIGATTSELTSHATTVPVLPNPVLYLTTLEPFSTGGKNFIRYKYSVDNLNNYPDELFAAAPELPPCGLNTKSSRTWVDFYDQRGKRLYGFCAIGKAADLNGIWFALEEDVIPPSFVYIEMNDRKTNTKYKSNLADTTP